MIMSNFLIPFIDDGGEVSSFCNRGGPATHGLQHIIARWRKSVLLPMGKPGGGANEGQIKPFAELRGIR